MKKFILIMFTVHCSLLTVHPFAQPCLPEGIIFTNQAQIDSFQINYPGCTEIEGNVDIDRDNIINLSGINVITYIGGDFRIWGNDILTSLSGLENLTHIGGSFWIFYNASLLSLSGVENLISIGQELHIGESEFNDGNPYLNSISALENLTSIGGILEISNNPSLTSLAGLDNIATSSITELFIFNNTALPVCNVQPVCDYLISPNGSVNIYNNASGCNNPEEVSNSCGNAFSCLPYGNYYFVTQSEIDNFQSTYPDCIHLKGNVTISGGYDITNLNGLTVIDSIEGSLIIKGNFILTTLSGLEGLTIIGGDLVIGIYGEQFWNHLLASLTGLENLISIGGSLIIDRDPSLVSLSGLDGLTSIGQSFWLGYTPSLTSISALSNLTYIGDNLMIASMYPENYSLQSLTGLENLSFIGGDIKIWGMDSLTNLLALENLNSIDGVFEIVGNDALTSLTGLDNIDAASIDHIIIRNNSSLSSCEVQSICDFLANPTGNITIQDNTTGCNNQTEVEEACDALGIDNIEVQNECLVFPNPVSGKLTLYCSGITGNIELIEIYNTRGVKVAAYRVNQTNSEITLDVKALPPGLYLLHLQAGNEVRIG